MILGKIQWLWKKMASKCILFTMSIYNISSTNILLYYSFLAVNQFPYFVEVNIFLFQPMGWLRTDLVEQTWKAWCSQSVPHWSRLQQAEKKTCNCLPTHQREKQWTLLCLLWAHLHRRYLFWKKKIQMWYRREFRVCGVFWGVGVRELMK